MQVLFSNQSFLLPFISKTSYTALTNPPHISLVFLIIELQEPCPFTKSQRNAIPYKL